MFSPPATRGPNVALATRFVPSVTGCRHLALVAVLAAELACDSTSRVPQPHEEASVVWRLDRPDLATDCDTAPLGRPRVIESDGVTALEFNGEDQALVVGCNPIEGLREFTVEVVFRPDPGGAYEQRFLHLQEDGSDDRLLIELRLRDDAWFLDTFLRSAGLERTLFAKGFRHPVGPWYHAAVVVDHGTVRHYVDMQEELSRAVEFEPLASGRVSIGARINRVSWYRGAIREVRFTPRALGPGEFLRP